MIDMDLVREEVLDALEKAYPQVLQKGEITARMVMDRLKKDKTTVYRLLAKEVEAGRLVEVSGDRIDEKGRVVKAWIKPPEIG